jgi:hypothetical protein
MSNKDAYGKIGIFLLIFLLLISIIMDQGTEIWATLETIDPSLANHTSLQLLWTTLATATLIQGFLIYSALLGSNSQFSPRSRQNKEENQ